jgi:hypothetical protein
MGGWSRRHLVVGRIKFFLRFLWFLRTNRKGNGRNLGYVNVVAMEASRGHYHVGRQGHSYCDKQLSTISLLT